MTKVVLTRAEQGLSNSIESTLEFVKDFGVIVQDVMEYQTVVGRITDLTEMIGEFKIDLERLIVERQKLEAELRQVRSDAAWEADAARDRAAAWDNATWK